MRVVTYNILDGAVGRESLVQEVLQAIRPDMIVLQEVFEGRLVEQLADDLGMHWYVAGSNSRRRLALLSGFPIIWASSHHPRPPIHHGILEAVVGPSSTAGEPRRSMRVFGVHLAPVGSLTRELWRLWEVIVLVRRLRSQPAVSREEPGTQVRKGNPPDGNVRSDRLLVMGDFNTVPAGDPVGFPEAPRGLAASLSLQANQHLRLAIHRLLAEGLVDCYRYLHPQKAGYTLPVPAPQVRLDYIFASPSLAARLRHSFVAREPAAVDRISDHYPVVADFNLWERPGTRQPQLVSATAGAR